MAVLDSLTGLGGQLTAPYPEKLIYDVVGLPAIRGQALVDNVVQQAEELEVAKDHVVVRTEPTRGRSPGCCRPR